MTLSKSTLLLFFIFLLSCDNNSKPKANFPILRLNAFAAGEMEKETNDVSYILNSTNLGPISLRLSWKPVTNVDLVNYNIYKTSNGITTFLKEVDDITKESTTIDTEINYENEESFQISVVNDNGVESSLSNSNQVSINITYGEPDAYTYEFNNDTLQDVTIEWNNSGNGLTNPIINVDAVRNNLLDSLSMNVMYKETEILNFRKIISIIGPYQQFGIERSSGQGIDKRFTITISDVKTKIFDNFLKIVSRDDGYFGDQSSDDPLRNFFKVDGIYEIYFYFYKKQNGRTYTYKTSLTETFTFPN